MQYFSVRMDTAIRCHALLVPCLTLRSEYAIGLKMSLDAVEQLSHLRQQQPSLLLHHLTVSYPVILTLKQKSYKFDTKVWFTRISTAS